MNREDQDFDQLRRVLKLKRYEQPPPRFFNDFSTRVVASLQATQASNMGNNWLQRLWETLELRPIVPVAFGAAVCGLLIAGALYTEAPVTIAPLTLAPAGGTGPSVAAVTPTTLPHVADYAQPAPFSNSTNPVPPGGSLFDQIRFKSVPAAHPMFK
jgi:hypothetical protein